MDLRQLLSVLGAKPGAQAQQGAQPGAGMLQQAAQVMQSRPYQLHMAEAQANGQQPMPPEQFMQMMGQQQQQKPQGLLGQ
jgi:hypothetical protein